MQADLSLPGRTCRKYTFFFVILQVEIKFYYRYCNDPKYSKTHHTVADPKGVRGVQPNPSLTKTSFLWGTLGDKFWRLYLPRTFAHLTLYLLLIIKSSSMLPVPVNVS